MIKKFKAPLIDDSGDLVIQDGEIILATDMDELVQEVRTVIKTNVWEWFLDPNHGFDYKVLWVKKPDKERITQAIYDAINQVERVTAIDDIRIDFDRARRKLSVFFVCRAGEELVEGGEVMKY